MLFIILILLFSNLTLHGHGFVEGTLIRTKTGYIPIEKLKEGDKVLCFSPDGNLTKKKITKVHRKKNL